MKRNLNASRLEVAGSSPARSIVAETATMEKEELIAFGFFLRREGKAMETIEGIIRKVKSIARRIDLDDCEAVKDYIILKECGEAQKEALANAYDAWVRFKGSKWDKPKFKREDKLPYIPTETEINQLIASLSPKLSAYCQLLKETGFRPGEAYRLTLDDFDFERGVVTLNAPEKGSKPRQVKISNALVAMIRRVASPQGNLWDVKKNALRRSFERRRNRLAEKLQNPNLRRIRLHTFRHFKATIEYHRTKDILHVKELLGHKRLENTLIYTHLVDWRSEEYVVKVAGNLEEATKLLEAGFEYVTEMEGKKLFRKRK